ncbi:hypothetical protein [Microbispora sp. NBRC 16548]|uniref:hypothetical protein n=1 Tax=Microbispora sp. NBRC 16548 TaxID=3030994 RepID=UPI0024A5F1DF|nr:hypothetical protein [Microbispora sp. NBRC 16548]GLX08055.1 hypothetical protein Misp03_49810 [Microbispora sp. NBRC 16548]
MYERILLRIIVTASVALLGAALSLTATAQSVISRVELGGEVVCASGTTGQGGVIDAFAYRDGRCLDDGGTGPRSFPCGGSAYRRRH